jgi:hypothetical protein
LNKFRTNYVNVKELDSGSLILVPKRLDRNFEFVDNFVTRYEKYFRFKYVDFSKMSVMDQIRICNSARVIFGSEGAAFANQVFMPDNSLVMPVSNQIERIDFHSSLAKYLEFSFYPILVDEFGDSLVGEGEILKILTNFFQQKN